MSEFLLAGISNAPETKDVGSGAGGAGDRKSKLTIQDLEPGPPGIELTHKQKQDIKNAFNVFDTDGTGSMQVKELKVN